MANRTVTLVRHCKTELGWKRCPAVIGKNGRVRPGWVTVKGKLKEYSQGHYEARFYEGSKVKYLSLGEDAAEALAACKRQEKLLVARDSASEAGAVIVEEKGRMNLAKALARFVEVTQDKGSSEAADKYRVAGEEFLMVTGRRYADEVVQDDFAALHRAMRKRGCSDRTIANGHSYVKAFLRYVKIDKDVFPEKGPAYEQKLPEIYSREELEAFFGSLTSEQHVVTFKLALQCGLREQELMHVQWSDIDFVKGTLHVRSKPDWDFAVKDKEERLLPLPSGLSALLEAYKKKGQVFITGTSGNKPNTHLLRTLKRLVKAAELHCGVCEPCIARGECEQWFLHKFRATYCTTLLRSGLDARSVMKLMGHSDIETTLRYLRPAEDAELQSKINNIW